jgi:hypothetical protein
MQVALLMDSASDAPYHRATVEAVGHAAAALGVAVDIRVHRTDAVRLTIG